MSKFQACYGFYVLEQVGFSEPSDQLFQLLVDVLNFTDFSPVVAFNKFLLYHLMKNLCVVKKYLFIWKKVLLNVPLLLQNDYNDID